MNREDNLLNGLQLSDVIYKYFPVKYLTMLIRRRLLRVDHTSTWEDVYENFFLKNEFVYGEMRGRADSLQGCVFGQSWTLQDESDAMWRIYSGKYRGNCAVRIRTTVQKLLDVVFPQKTSQEKHASTTFLGKVLYWSDDDLWDWQTQPVMVEDMSRKIRDSFFIKRLPFEHEQEVRVIKNLPGEFRGLGIDCLLFEVDPFDLIDEFVIEPRLAEDQADEVRSKLIGLGVEAKKIRQSDLYKFRPSKIRIE